VPDTPLTGLPPKTAEEIVRRELHIAVQRNAWKVAAAILCVWLVGGITVLGVGYFWVESRNERFAYAVNSNSCNARKLIDKSISDTKKALASYIDAAHDPSASESAKERNEQRITDATKSLVGLRAFRNLYQTVPSRYDCRRLPLKPPS
jgi:hypothetical protein